MPVYYFLRSTLHLPTTEREGVLKNSWRLRKERKDRTHLWSLGSTMTRMRTHTTELNKLSREVIALAMRRKMSSAIGFFGRYPLWGTPSIHNMYTCTAAVAEVPLRSHSASGQPAEQSENLTIHQVK